jgi:hypothetical protein
MKKKVFIISLIFFLVLSISLVWSYRWYRKNELLRWQASVSQWGQSLKVSKKVLTTYSDEFGEIIPTEIAITLKDGIDLERANVIAKENNAEVVYQIPELNSVTLYVPWSTNSKTVQQLVQKLRSYSEIKSVYPNTPGTLN